MAWEASLSRTLNLGLNPFVSRYEKMSLKALTMVEDSRSVMARTMMALVVESYATKMYGLFPRDIVGKRPVKSV